MYLAHLLRSCKQRYLQFLPVLTTVGRSTNIHNMTICICSDRKTELLTLSSYTIPSGYHCKISLIRPGWDCFGCQVTATLREKEADRLARMGSDCHFCRPEPYVPLSASIVWDINRKWVIDAYSIHWIALNSCRQSKLAIKHLKLQTSKFSWKFWFFLSWGIVALMNISTGWDWQQALFVHS
jgi:hypothetical protein